MQKSPCVACVKVIIYLLLYNCYLEASRQMSNLPNKVKHIKLSLTDLAKTLDKLSSNVIY